MNNFEHEIQCPDDIAIRKFLWNDYFHDSEITEIHFKQRPQIVTMQLVCVYDIDAAFDKLKGSWDECHAYIEANKEKYTYLLTFFDVAYFHEERCPLDNDYISGCFIDTAILRKLSMETKHPLYHFRIRISDGYIDIIFSKFLIRKQTGRVNYSFIDPQEISNKTPSKECIQEMIRNGEYTDDLDKSLDLQHLYNEHDPQLLQVARKCLKNDPGTEVSKLYAAYLIGKLGDESDIPKLFDFCFSVERAFKEQSICRCSTILPKRIIMDAVEMIKYRLET